MLVWGWVSLASSLITQLSGGEQRKALIACAMVQEPRILFLDEPTANLDLGWREQIVFDVGAVVCRVGADDGAGLSRIGGSADLLSAGWCFLRRAKCGRMGRRRSVLTNERVAELYGAGLSVCARERPAMQSCPVGRCGLD